MGEKIPHIAGGEVEPQLAPPHTRWHYRYAMNMRLIGGLFLELTQDPAFDQAEDLGDYVEAMGTLHSFRPRTREDFEQHAQTEYEKKFEGKSET